MSGWTWDYNTDDHTHVTGGLPPGVIAEVERIAAELSVLGRDAETVGRPTGRPGGLREFDILGGRGFISFLAVPRHECVYVCRVTWYE
ncbi:hypothetical protein ABT143_14770 [Streptomyces sp. NPDC002033]|uniref:hypothetical protein n=1 Tax=unclassified Streptomyces TaxID=2593676 RepID=UPI00331DC6D7